MSFSNVILSGGARRIIARSLFVAVVFSIAVVGGRTVRAAAGLLPARIATDKNLDGFQKQLSSHGKQNWDYLCNECEHKGRMLSIDEFAKAMIHAPVSMHQSDYDIVWFLFEQAQKPFLPSGDLPTLFQNLRQSINSIRVKYVVKDFEHDTLNSTTAGEFASDKGKLFCSSTVNAPGQQTTVLREGYDLKAFREYRVLLGNVSTGSVQSLNSKGRLYSQSNPLVMCSLISASELGSQNFESNDMVLQAKQQALCEAAVNLNGNIVYTIGSPIREFYVAANFGYALCGRCDSRYEFDAESGMLKESDAYAIQTNSDFAAYGNGLWLPNKTELQRYSHGKPVSSQLTEMQSWEVNKPIEAALFTNVFPKDTLVADALRKAVYRVGSSRSAESTISNELPEKMTMRFWLIAANVLAVVVLVLLLLRRRKQRRAGGT